MKRKVLTLLAGAPLLGACISIAGPDGGNGTGYSRMPADRYGSDHAMRAKFKGIAVGELIIDAVSKKEGVTFYNENGDVFNETGTLGPKRVDKGAYPGGERGVPKTIRATWRIGEFALETAGINRGWVGGTIIGDYTVKVAERIPDGVLNYIRDTKRQDVNTRSRALRLKIRLADHGILIGWDVQERFTNQYGTFSEFVMAGGDFKEARIYNGKVEEKGWYFMPDGKKFETDF